MACPESMLQMYNIPTELCGIMTAYILVKILQPQIAKNWRGKVVKVVIDEKENKRKIRSSGFARS